MLLVMMLTTIILSTTFMFMKHPLSMGFTLLLQSVMVACTTGFYNFNFWYSYILFLIMVGGMLVLFIYMTSIASNEKFKYSNKIVVIITLLIITSAIIYIIMDKFLYYQMISTLETMPIEQMKNWKLSLNKYINYPSSIIMTSMIIYLFISLIAIVKITSTSYGALRQKF